MPVLRNIQEALRAQATPERKKSNERYFKTGPGQYGAGDIFLGVTVPATRLIAKEFKDIALDDCSKLLLSPIHEERLCALHILVARYQRSKDPQERKRLYDFYLQHVAGINNWDLVDTSAPYIVGAYCYEVNSFDLLYAWIVDRSIWKRRIALLATQYGIRHGNFTHIVHLVEQVLNDHEDLIHKAAGWMLREVGKRDQDCLETFLKKYYKKMPRTMLRYAVEKFDEPKRRMYIYS